MQTLSELDLYRLPMGEKTMGVDPMPQFANARERHPWLCEVGPVRLRDPRIHRDARAVRTR